jgi:hypothetical protein
MSISDGTGSFRDRHGNRVYIEDVSQAAITSSNIAAMRAALGTLTSIFGIYSSVEMHGCRVARGPQGRSLIDQLARIWGVPVTAASGYQYAGGTATFRFEGPTYTAFPTGLDLKSWARSLPALAEMSVP